MMIREGLHNFDDVYEEDLVLRTADTFYLTRLPKVLDIPAYDPVRDPLDEKIKAHIMKFSGLTELDIDSWFLACFIEANRDLPESARQEANTSLIRILGKDADYVFKVHSHASKPEGVFNSRRVHERLMPGWNNYTRQEFKEILSKNPKRSNVIISVGSAHLPAFSDDHSFIG